jgi:hypothetical protein
VQKVGDLFEATACNPCQVANIDNGNAGFRIPEYQRPYDWSKENIHRLMTDIFAGFERLSHTTKASAFTFLGTLILVRDQTQEPMFKGKSFSIVDGQQRLTTLTLVACALIERLRLLGSTLPSLSADIQNWLNIESDHIETGLGDCITGAQKVRGNQYYPFPRIIRSEDIRADSKREELLSSGIAKFLSIFCDYIDNDDTNFNMPNIGDSREANKVIENFNLIRYYCRSLNDIDWYTDNDCQILEAHRFQHGGCKQLWEKAQDVLGNDGAAAMSEIAKSEEGCQYLRTLLLASYFCNCVAVTTVITTDETAAFDIFDALNTTGEPLTALETLKPQVIVAENSSQYRTYKGSDCEIAFKEIDEILSNDYPDTSKKQNETKDLVITFLLYLEGRKTSRELSSQRSELRRAFDKSSKVSDGASSFMRSLAGVARYRSDYWVTTNSGKINGYHHNAANANEVKVLSAFISAMKTSLTLPILTRYWIAAKESGDFSDYVNVLRAVTAFLAIRRAATGGTDGIDTCFRDIMETGNSKKKFGLCSGAKHENSILSLETLKAALKEKLSSTKVKFGTKDEWLDHVVDVPIYSQAKPLARFLLFCGTHHTGVEKDTGFMTREDIVPSDDRKYLCFEQWINERYLTVEHVAPNSDKPEGWPADIYENARVKNTIGNLVLLPTEENSTIGKASWPKKKIFYSALTSKTVEQRKLALSEAKREGMTFSKKTEKLIIAGERFSMLDGTFDVIKWDKSHIQKRSRRIASLAWDILYPWLN